MARPHIRKPFSDYVGCIGRQIQTGEFLGFEPAHLVGVAAWLQFTLQPLAQEINENVVILDPVTSSDKAIENAENLPGLNGQASFFISFAGGCFAQQFANLEHAPRNRPFAGERRMSALNQEYAAFLDNDGAYADQRSFGIFAS